MNFDVFNFNFCKLPVYNKSSLDLRLASHRQYRDISLLELKFIGFVIRPFSSSLSFLRMDILNYLFS